MAPEFRVYIPQEVSPEFVEGIQILRGDIRGMVVDNEHDSFIENVREALSMLPETTKINTLRNPKYNAYVPQPWKVLYETLTETQKRQLTRATNLISWHPETKDLALADRKKVKGVDLTRGPLYAGVKTLEFVQKVFVD